MFKMFDVCSPCCDGVPEPLPPNNPICVGGREINLPLQITHSGGSLGNVWSGQGEAMPFFLDSDVALDSAAPNPNTTDAIYFSTFLSENDIYPTWNGGYQGNGHLDCTGPKKPMLGLWLYCTGDLLVNNWGLTVYLIYARNIANVCLYDGLGNVDYFPDSESDCNHFADVFNHGFCRISTAATQLISETSNPKVSLQFRINDGFDPWSTLGLNQSIFTFNEP